MAKKQAADAVQPEATEKPAGSKKRLMIIVGLVLVVLLVLGGGAKALGLVGGGVAEAAGAEPTPVPTPTPSELGTLVQLESITLNLAAGRFLKLGVAIELAPDVIEEPPAAPIYDELIELFGPMTFEELSDAAVRARTKIALLEQLSTVYGASIVEVYYTEFVMQ